MHNAFDFFKNQHLDPDLDELVKQFQNFFDRILAEKMIRAQTAGTDQIKTQIGYAWTSVIVASHSLKRIYPAKAGEIEAALTMASSAIAFLVSAVLVALLNEQQSQKPDISGTWNVKSDTNSN